ncbi:MAG: M1 family metallopeptidase [Nocardioidaceae bacterium]|nr:M1 family metallopeptidase [Nocardioidaceae bacterium]
MICLRRPLVASLLVLGLLASACASGEDDPSAGESTSPVSTASPSETPDLTTESTGQTEPTEGTDPYWPQDGNAGTDALHYDIDVRYDLATGQLRGTTTITMRATARLKRFSLDLLVPVTRVRVDDEPATSTKPDDHELLITPASAIAKGQRFDVEVRYAGRPGELAYDGESNWLADRSEVVTMNEPHMSPWWFPANDHPGDKATFDIAVSVPKSNVVISNGDQVADKVRGGWRHTRWQMSDPMATYLAFFAAGDFIIEKGTSAGGIPYLNAVSRGLPADERANALQVLRRSGAITDWLVQRLGPYPFDSTGGVVTALDVGFALENQSRPTYGDWIYPSVVVHELAHQWFGDSVSVRQWRDIWLNEGFASYLEAAYAAAHDGPSVNQWLHERYRAECPRATSKFWKLDLSDPGAEDVFAQPVYDRGALVLGALRNRIGAGTFDDLLRGWVREHAEDNVSVAQFEKRAAQVAGEDLSGFFDAWLRSGRAPAGVEQNGLDHTCA